MMEGWWWVQTKHYPWKGWSQPYVEYVEQDVIEHYNKEGWKTAHLIKRIDEPVDNIRTDAKD